MLLPDAAESAWQLLTDPLDDHAPPDSLAFTLYGRAVAEWLLPGCETADLSGRAASLGIRVDDRTRAMLARFDRFIDAGRLGFSGLTERHQRSGLGAALVGVIAQGPAWRHARPVDGGYAQPLTAETGTSAR